MVERVGSSLYVQNYRVMDASSSLLFSSSNRDAARVVKNKREREGVIAGGLNNMMILKPEF